MRTRRIGLALGLLLVPALIVGGLACGKKANPVSTTGGGGGGPPPGDPAPFADGIWELSYTLTAAGGDPSCANANGSFVDTFSVAAGGVDGFIGSNCTFAVSGTHFDQTCRDTFAYSGTCRFVITISGSGDVHPGTFTATYTATVAPTGNCSLFSVFPCTFTIPATGRVIGVTVSGARRLQVGSVSEGIERLAVERAVEPVRGATRPR